MYSVWTLIFVSLSDHVIRVAKNDTLFLFLMMVIPGWREVEGPLSVGVEAIRGLVMCKFKRQNVRHLFRIYSHIVYDLPIPKDLSFIIAGGGGLVKIPENSELFNMPRYLVQNVCEPK